MPDLKVYIAACANELQRAEHWTQRLEEAGITVVSSWPASVRAVGESNPRNATQEERAGWARTCGNEVLRADVVWLLCPSSGYTTRGAWSELGIAWQAGRPLISSGDTKQSIFTALGYEYESDEEAFTVIRDQWAHGAAAQQPTQFTIGTRVKATRRHVCDDTYTAHRIVERAQHNGKIGTVCEVHDFEGFYYGVQFVEGTAFFDHEELAAQPLHGPPLTNGTRVKATVRRTDKGDYTAKAKDQRLRHDGKIGTVCECHNSHGPCYGIQFEEGIAFFEPDELEIQPSQEQ